MKAAIQNNFKTTRELIKRNVDTIVQLVEQAKGLENIVNSINGSGGTNDELKNRLEQQLDQLKESILVLVKQTEELFRSYDEMVEDAFK